MKKTLLLLVLLGSLSAYAQITITAEVRPRFEFRNGFKTLRPEGDFEPASFVEQRTRLYFNFKREKLELHIAAQDIRMWGNHNQIYKTDNKNMTNIYEGWVLYNFAGNWYFKLGRQALNYDNARFLGNLDWAQQGRSHDAFLVRWAPGEAGQAKDIVIDAGVALNNSGTEPAYLMNSPYTLGNYKNMQFIHVKKKFDKTNFSFLFQNDGRQTSDTNQSPFDVNYRQTVALAGDGTLGQNLKLAGEFYYQFGKNANNMDVAAFLASLSLTIATDLTPIIIGADFLSGTANGESRDMAFNPLYGTNHKFYGYMDYFYVGNAHGQFGRSTGLIDGYLKFKFKLAENGKHFLATDFHYFMSPVALYGMNNDGSINTGNELGNGLGTEIDLVYALILSKDIKFHFGYSHMLATESMEAIKMHNMGGMGSRNATNNWAWIMIQFKPEIFKK